MKSKSTCKPFYAILLAAVAPTLILAANMASGQTAEQQAFAAISNMEAQNSDIECQIRQVRAQIVLLDRYANEQMSSALANAWIENQDSPERQQAIRAIILAAYDRPRFSVNEYIDRDIAEFGNSVFLACIQGD